MVIGLSKVLSIFPFHFTPVPVFDVAYHTQKDKLLSDFLGMPLTWEDLSHFWMCVSEFFG